MFQRTINKFFLEWKDRKKRKPLVIRGARQVGKTSAVNLFARDSFYAETKSLIDVDPVFESILTGFKDDVLKYASLAKTKYIQYLIEHASKYIGLPVKYENFEGSGFRSREMSEATIA